MAKLYFRHGAMDSSKSANLIMVAFNYEKQGKKSLVLKPVLDTRSENGKVESRVGISLPCLEFNKDTNVFDLVNDYHVNHPIDCVLVDECQFMEPHHAAEFALVCDELDIPVICYGLKNTYNPGKVFDGSVALLYYADTIEEIKTICTFCNKKATMPLRLVGGKPVYEGDIIKVGDTDANAPEHYLPTCRKHFFHPPLDELEKHNK